MSFAVMASALRSRSFSVSKSQRSASSGMASSRVGSAAFRSRACNMIKTPFENEVGQSAEI
jgi:hypothetical protein